MAADETQDLKFKLLIHAPADEVYHAFTNSAGVSDWFCSVAHVEARQGGRFYLWWENGYYATGEFAKLIPVDRIAFSWHGRGEPDFTLVKVAFKLKDGDTLVRVSHQGLGSGPNWKRTRKAYKRGWRIGLENLKSVLETGQDLRYFRRPLLGFTSMKAIEPEEASKAGLPEIQGLLVLGVVDGLCAQKAGLRAGDMLVKFAGEEVTNMLELNNLLNQYRSGEKVKLVYYRGHQRISTQGLLSQRPFPNVPATIQELAKAIDEMYARLNLELGEILKDVDNSRINIGGSSLNWSIRETLGHLIANEREIHGWISRLIEGQEMDFLLRSNQPVRVRATISAFPNLASLIAELKRNQAETVAMVADLPVEFVNRRRSYWRLAFEMLQNPPLHYQEHSILIGHILEQARQAEAEKAVEGTFT